MSYKLTLGNTVTRLSDGATLPARFENGQLVELDPYSPFVKELREWITAGNTPQAANPVPPAPPMKDIVDMIAELSSVRRAALKTELAK